MITVNKEKHLITFNNLKVVNCFTLKPYNFRDSQVSIEEQQNEYNQIMNDLDFKANIFIKPNQTHTNNVSVVTELGTELTKLNPGPTAPVGPVGPVAPVPPLIDTRAPQYTYDESTYPTGYKK
jgi:hypothetical protein